MTNHTNHIHNHLFTNPRKIKWSPPQQKKTNTLHWTPPSIVPILQHTRGPESLPIPQPIHPEHLIQQSAWQVKLCMIVLSAGKCIQIHSFVELCLLFFTSHNVQYFSTIHYRYADRTMLQLCGLDTPTTSSISSVHSTAHSSSRVLANSPTNPTGT